MLRVIVQGGPPAAPDAALNLGQNGWRPGYLGQYGTASAFIFELVATFLFVLMILGSTHAKAPARFAGLAIGLTLVGIHLVGIDITGVSVNPARGLGPALLAGPGPMSQLWLFIAAPGAGAVLAAIVNRILEAPVD